MRKETFFSLAKFQGKKILTDPLIILGLGTFLLMSVFACVVGSNRYDRLLNGKEIFREQINELQAETGTVDAKKSIKLHWVLYVPPPFCFLFDNDFSTVYAVVGPDPAPVTRSVKRYDLPFSSGNVFFLQVLFVSTTALMLYAGLTAFSCYKEENKQPYPSRMGEILVRMLLLDIIFIPVLVLTLLAATLFGAPFPAGQLKLFSYFVIYWIVFVDFFYAAGVLIATLTPKEGFLITAFFSWFILALALPELLLTGLDNKYRKSFSVDNVPLLDITYPGGDQRGKTITPLQKFHLLKTALPEDQEDSAHQQLWDSIRVGKEKITTARKNYANYEKYFIYYPPLSVNILRSTLSGRSYLENLHFLEFIIDLKKDVLENLPLPDKYMKILYIPYIPAAGDIDIKQSVQFFNAKSHLPGVFYQAIGITLLYIAVMLTIAHFLIPKRFHLEIKFKTYIMNGKIFHYNSDCEVILGFTENGVTLTELTNLFILYQVEVLELKQVHSNTILFDHDIPTGSLPQKEGDGIIMTQDDKLAVIKTADCVPLFFWSETGTPGGILHVGRRGLQLGIELELLKLLSTLENPPTLRDLKFYMGPSIEARCYEVGSEIYDEFAGKPYRDKIFHKITGDKYHLDIKKGIVLSLQAAGVNPARIAASPLCTYCEAGRLPSYRRDQKTGNRIYSFMRLR